MEMIDAERWYRPSEIAKLGFILNSRGNKDYSFVLKLIRDGRLKASNYAKPDSQQGPYWRVKGSWVLAYKAEYEKPTEITP